MSARTDTMRLRPFSALVPTAETGQWTDHGRALYAVRLLAAQLLLARWITLGARFLVLDGGRVGPWAVEVDGLSCWPLASIEAAQILCASVAAGERYQGWAKAWRTAMRESGAASPRCEACALSGCAGHVVTRAEGGFDDYPEHVTHACERCGNGWTETGAEQ